MKKLYFLLFLISGWVNAQIVNIPDANFKAKLLMASPDNQIAYSTNVNGHIKIDSNNDGEIQVSEAAQVTYLDVQFSNINSVVGIEFFTNLIQFYCTNNNLSTIDVSGLVNLNYLYLKENNLTQIDVSALVNLKTLDCEGNNLTSLDLSSLTNLENLFVNYNQLTTITFNASGVFKKIHCTGNVLTSLDLSMFPTLTEIYCSNNLLTSLNVANLVNLKMLFCGYNQLTSIDVSDLIALTSLQCFNNLLTSLDLTGLTSVLYFGCHNNLLTTIDFSSLNSVRNISLGNEGFGTVDFSTLNNPDLVVGFDFWGGNQTVLDLSVLPNLLKTSYYYTNLTSVDISENHNVDEVFFFNNFDLTYVNMKNGKLNSSFFSVCPLLEFVCTDDVETVNVQNQLNDYGLASVVCNSYCSYVPGGNYNTITGTLTVDNNNNGCDTADGFNPYIRLNITGGLSSGATFTNAAGQYGFYTLAGNFTVSPNIENPSWFTISPNNANFNFTNTNNNSATQNFCITPNGIHPDLEIVIAPVVPSRPGFEAVYKIVYRNKGNQTLSQAYGINFFYNNNLMDLVSTSIVPTSVVSGGISWDYANLQPFESREILVTFNINAPTAANPVNINDVLTFTASILPQAGDENTSDNLYVYNEVVIGSYDPNDITCLEGDVVSPAEIGDYLHYMIRFENTGTAEAENIVVRTEVNPADFDINSLQLLNTSHPVNAKITGNVVEFIFQNILLESGGHGNVLLKVKSKDTLQQGDNVNKRANIYFDYNYPVATNEAETIFQALSNPDFEQDQSISVYPNPTKDKVNVSGDFTLQSVQLYDVQGRLLQTQLANDNQSIIDISVHSNGVYFIKVTSDKGIKVGKIVKE